MAFFFLCVLILIAGYFVYGTIVARIFGIQPHRKTPAFTRADGVDYIAMPTWKIFMIQLLDIAGLGPIVGPILGALYGPAALLWIVLGTILAGAVHDFLSGMFSVRLGGESISEIVGEGLGKYAKYVMRFFAVILMVLVGIFFVTAPAKLLCSTINVPWVKDIYLIIAIFVYYFLATIIPIDKIIGRLYPFFGVLLLIMTFGIAGGLIYHHYNLLPNLNFWHNTYPANAPQSGSHIWPGMFIVISCAALSGFHSTQSPLMARCLRNEKYGQFVFYGAMVVEGIIGLIWVTVGLSFYKSPEMLQNAIHGGTVIGVIKDVAQTLLGGVGGFLAILGVIVLPITSGDTAFRSSRLILAESFHIEQKKVRHRLYVAIPLFAVGIVMTRVGIHTLWLYVGWSNQSLAAIVLWALAALLVRSGKFHWIASVPATFITAVCVTYILNAKIGFNLDYRLSCIIGVLAALVAFVVFLVRSAYLRRRPLITE